MTDHEEAAGDRFASPEQMAANFREYLAALDAERAVIEDALAAVENGDLEPPALLDTLPDRMPLESWQVDEFDPTDPDDGLDLEDDHGE